MAPQHVPQIKGLASAPEFWVDALHDIQFHGVNTLFVPYKLVHAKSGVIHQIPFVVRCPTGAITAMHRRLIEFAREHRLLDQDGTR